MRRAKLVLILGCALALIPSWAGAYEWAIQLNGPQLSVFSPSSDELADLLGDSPLVGSAVGLGFDVYQGLTVDLGFAGAYGYRGYSHDENDPDERPFAAVEVASNQMLFGLRYGRRVLPFWAPWVALDAAFGVWRVQVYDGLVDADNDGPSIGGRASLGSDFFPFHWAAHEYARGLGLSAAAYYDLSSIDGLGVIEDGGGWGVAFGLVYRFPTVHSGRRGVWTEQPPYQAPPEQPEELTPDQPPVDEPQPEDDNERNDDPQSDGEGGGQPL